MSTLEQHTDTPVKNFVPDAAPKRLMSICWSMAQDMLPNMARYEAK
jgi:hypothetical protein